MPPRASAQPSLSYLLSSGLQLARPPPPVVLNHDIGLLCSPSLVALLMRWLPKRPPKPSRLPRLSRLYGDAARLYSGAEGGVLRLSRYGAAGGVLRLSRYGAAGGVLRFMTSGGKRVQF